MALNKKTKDKLVLSENEMSEVLGKKEYFKAQKEIIQKGITVF